MERYTRNRTYFEQFAPRGLILHSSHYHAYIYYRDGQFRYLDDYSATPSLSSMPVGEQVLDGGWRMFSNLCIANLRIYRHPTTHIYRR